ncbi:MAG TPA: tyrosine-type recombinase/integrase [Kofleriaceae bacterium]|nr:tyrosine-type recombinase/integrase [Kofleriaceae bacterium]
MTALLEHFEVHLRQERMRGTETVKRYVSILREFCSFLRRVHADAALSEITHRELSAFLRERATTSGTPSPTSWNMALSALRALYAYLNHAEVLPMNPTLRIERHKVASREPVPLSLDEFLALVEAAEASGERYRRRNVAIVQLLFHTALRVAELVSLDVDQVDWHARVLCDVRTKGSKWLSAPFNDMVSQALEAYVAERGASRTVSEGAVFVSNRGKRLSVRSVQGIVKGLGKAAGISRAVTPHLLRHSSASELVELGTPIRVVQEVLGHAAVTTTERYVHVKAGGRRAAIDALGARVEQARRKRAA